MTPRPSIHALAVDDSADDVIQLARRTGHSRFPVYDESMDDIVGIVHLKAAVGVPRERRSDVPAAALATEPLRVPEAVHLDTLVSELRARGYQMAIVVDEYGGTDGIVTLEDLVEEIIGDIHDEYDVAEEPSRALLDGDVEVDGLLNLEDFEDRTGLELPEGPYETVAGFVINELGRLPVVGESVVALGRRFTVTELDGRRIARVRLTPEPAERDDDRATGSTTAEDAAPSGS
jgi:CBS domain containing-hemolysin-like protein